MGRLCVISMDHNLSSVDQRSDFSSHISSIASDLTARGVVGEHLKLETCNRAELYIVFSGGGAGEVIDGLAGAKVLYDYGAVRHLLRVLLGLESMARGESHIVSQVKSAYGASGGCGKVLHKLFQRALGITASLRARHP